MENRIFGGSDGGEASALLTRSPAKGHGEEEGPPKDGVDHADGGEHADPLEPLPLQPAE